VAPVLADPGGTVALRSAEEARATGSRRYAEVLEAGSARTEVERLW
jgi:hypothetical protein